MHRDIKQGEEARQIVKQGIDKAADIVKATLGVQGRNVILDTNPYTQPTNTNDGVTILRELSFENPFENVGLKAIKEAASRTNDVAGDGTTTASVLMQAIADYGNRAIIAGADPIQVRKGIEKAAKYVSDGIRNEALKATDLETLVSTATISCGNEELGRLVAEVIHASGVDGVVTLEDNPEAETITERTEGLKLRGGYIVQNFINVPELQQVALNGVPIFVTNQSIVAAQEMGKIMECAFALKQKQVVIIANSIEGDALITALKNWVDKKFFALPIRVIAYGDMGEGVLRDVAALTGATFFDSMANMQIMDMKPEDLGTASKIVTTRHETTVVTDNGAEDRITELQSQIKATDREFEKESLRERIAKLNNALFTIKVGGLTDTERQERKLRIEDAINATKAALTDGVVAGGGSALYRNSRYTEEFAHGVNDEGMGYMAVLRACEAPLRQMAVNGGMDIDRSDLAAIAKNKKKAIDFKTGEVVNAFEIGIIDPVKVVTSALENAASAAALFLVTESVVVRVEEPKEEQI